LFAIDNPESGMDFIKQHSNEMEEEVIKQHIGLYVNEFTVELGEKGHKAVDILKEMAEKTPSP